MEWIPGGTFLMGSNHHYPEEAPAHRVRVDGFWMDKTPVTNADFARFVQATGYVTFCEKPIEASHYPGARPEMLQPASVVFVAPPGPVDLRDPHQWWHFIPGANWRQPQGPGSSIEQRLDHPVVHVSFADVQAYLKWTSKKLPTEAEWEYAARGGHEAREFSWGDELEPAGRQLANVWQGQFPWQNLEKDGFHGTSPVGAFPANDYGLLDMIGNVWEWTADWYAPRHPEEKQKACCIPKNPRGPQESESHDPRVPLKIPRKVMKGGSHLCAPNYCRRYRPAARMAQPVDTSTSHLGFRGVVRGERSLE
ncbi:MAG: formylglycine-generating enzyme family protein [Bdellovibrionaceae bacterium]|nr:formylglycine-generating enzyme family protein [Pseudobdellovibrionaceae bacterium]MBX3033985.1 formylglycine-generating enzyme family protein [Pseudobdellovibrionaceae bacterium]